jgi:ribonucleoside-diphosphate reductase alpha chain
VGLYPDGRPGELFITMAKEGSTIGGLMDCFGTAVSMSLQYGVPLDVYVNKFSHTRFEPMGFTKNPDIHIAKSIVDYIFRWLGNTFLPGYREANKPSLPASADTPSAEPGEPETEPRPAATTAGGPNAAQGSANIVQSPNGSVPGSGNGRHGRKQASKRNGSSAGAAAMDRLATPLLAEAAAVQASRSEQFASFQTDSPACDNCGAITVRSGNCYLCYNCGTSMGCS